MDKGTILVGTNWIEDGTSVPPLSCISGEVFCILLVIVFISVSFVSGLVVVRVNFTRDFFLFSHVHFIFGVYVLLYYYCWDDLSECCIVASLE